MSSIRGVPWIAKLKAFGAHITISVVIFAAVIAAVIELWYPEPYFWVDGGLFVLSVAAFVDVGLGPTITLVVYAPGRSRMRQILAGIATAQLLALGAGVYLLHEHRPLLAAFIGFPRNEFFPVTPPAVKGGARPMDELLKLSSERPALVYIEMPADREEAKRLLLAGLSGGTSVFQRTDLYRPLQGDWLSAMLQAGRTEQRLDLVFRDPLPPVRQFVAARGAKFDDFAFVPLNGRYGRALLVFNRSDGRLVGSIRMKERGARP